MREDNPVSKANEWLNPSYITALEQAYHRFKQKRVIHLFDVEQTERLLGELEESVGDRFFEEPLDILAVGYGYDISGYPDVHRPRVIAHGRAVLRTIQLQELNNVDQPVFRAELLDPIDETVMEPVVIPLFGVLSAEQSADTAHHLLSEYIRTSRVFAARLMADMTINFYTLPAHEQHRLLYEKVAKELLADVAVEYDESVMVTVDCEEVYEAKEQGVLVRQPGRIVSGVIIDVAYIESSLSEPIHFTQKEDFLHEAQLPSFVIKQETGEICYIPAGSVADFRSESEDY